VFSIRLIGNRTYVLISDPEAIRSVFGGFGNPDSVSIGNDELRPLLGDNSLLILNGPRHQQDRKLIAPLFRPGKVACYGSVVADIAYAAGREWKCGDIIPVLPFVRSLGIAVIIAIVFGLRAGPRFQQFLEAIERIVDIVNGPMLYFALLQRDLGNWSPGGKIWKARDVLFDLIDAEIAARGRSRVPETPNLLDLLLSTKDEHGEYRSDAAIRDQTLTMLLAGHDPTAAATAWALYWIHKKPAVAEAIRAELASGPSDPSGPAALPYLDAVCQETLRLYPVVAAVERITHEPVSVGGYDLPSGVHLAPCIFLAHHRPDIFPEPESFIPERFLNRRYPPSVFFPFGGGPRRCIGADFAPFQIKLVLASLMRRFQFNLVDRGAIHPVLKGATIAPSAKLALQVTAVEAVQGRCPHATARSAS
jgi:cytochrome P450